MLNGASEIIGGVPGIHLDPAYLIRSQKQEAVGYIMVTYQSQPLKDEKTMNRFFDVLLFRGSEIIDTTRMNQALRFHIHHDDMFRTFKEKGRVEPTLIHLFLSTEDQLHLFRSTIYFEPSLKSQLKGLSRKQLARLFHDSSCHRGIIECNDFSSIVPRIDLHPVAAPGDLDQYRPPFRQGHILLYDTDKNLQLVNDRISSLTGPLTGIPSQESPLLRPRLDIFDTSQIPNSLRHEPQLDEKEAQELIDTINKILNAPPEPIRPAESAQPPILITQSVDNHRASDDTAVSDGEGVSENIPRPPKSKTPKKPTTRKAKSHGDAPAAPTQNPAPESNIPTTPTTPSSQPATPNSPQIPSVAEQESPTTRDDAAYIRLFERLFRYFRQQIFDSFGEKSEDVISQAESKVTFLTPEFDLRNLNTETAIAVLDLVETIINLAPFFKRGKLRESALTLVADLYNKQYELLEERRAIERVEQFYYRLKRQ